MDEIEKYEIFMRGVFKMLDNIRTRVLENKLSYADDLEKQILTPCEEEWKQAWVLYHEFHKTMNIKNE